MVNTKAILEKSKITNRSSIFYLICFYGLNIIYLFFEIYRSHLQTLFSSNPTQQKYYFDQIIPVVNFMTGIEYILLLINIAFLILCAMRHKSNKNNIMQYLIITGASLLSIKGISMLLKLIVGKPYLAQQNLVIVQVTVLVFIYFVITQGYKLLIKK